MMINSLESNQNKLYQLVIDGCTIQNVVDLARTLLGNPIILPDVFCDLIAISNENEPIDDKQWNALLDKVSGYTQQFDFRQSGVTAKSMEDYGKTKILNSKMEHRWIYSRIDVAGVHYAQICVPEYHRLFEKDDVEFIDCLKKIVIHLLNNQNVTPVKQHLKERFMIKKWLDGSKFSVEQIKNTFLFSPSLSSTVYAIAVIAELDKDLETNPKQIDINWFEKNINGSRCVLNDNEIVILITQHSDTFGSFFDNSFIKDYLTNNNYALGLSRCFKDLNDFRDYFSQAKAAYNCCIKKKCDWLQYDYCFLDTLYETITAHLPQKLYTHHVAVQIANYDQHNHTDFIKNLYEYLVCNHSINMMAKNLKIHRNTANYRITRINDLFDIPYEDQKEMTALGLSLGLLRYISESNH